MGKLYLAHDPKLDREVAIKTLLEGLDDDETRGRFAREARAAANLAHRNIVVVHDFGEHDGRPFIAMEYVRGETLHEKIRRRAPIDLKLKLRYISELCAGLASAHAARVIHRDIKPSNLMVTSEGVLKILDFGIARQGESKHTRTGVLMGTLNYMSPEQMGGQTVDHRSDIFAVGSVSYELLSYAKAFPGTFQDGLFGRLLAAAPESLAIRCPDLDPEVIRIVERAIKREPDHRYQGLGEMCADIDAVRARLQTGPHLPVRGRAFDETLPITPPSEHSSGIRKRLVKRRSTELKVKVESAEQALGRGDLDTAEEECERALGQARDALVEGALEVAIRVAQDVLRLDDRHDEALRIKREATEQQRQREALEQRAHAAVEQERARQLAKLLADAEMAIAEQRWDDALGELGRAAAFDPGSELVAPVVERAQAGKAETEARAQREQAINQVLEEAEAALAAGDLEAAQAKIEAVQLLDAEAPRAVDLLGRVQSAIERREAEHRAREAAARFERECRVTLRAATAQLEASDFQAALALVHRILEQSPEHSDALELRDEVHRRQVAAHLQEARIYRGGRDWGAALAEIEAALRLQPDLAEALELRREVEDAETVATALE